jgi:hypothetical protein
VIIVGLTAVAGTAYAQEPQAAPAPAPDSSDEATTNDGDLPTPQSDNDAQPEVASPGSPSAGLVEQAGTGGNTGYGRAGVLELGGSLGLQVATGLTELNISPTVGWFVADNFQISGIMGLSHVRTDNDDATLVGLLFEPSYHLPFNRTTFGFFGLGLGGAYVSELGAGFALAPRLGANFIVGRSGILSPTISWQYTTHDSETVDTGDNQQRTVVAVSSALRVNIGYTVMW